MPTVQQCPSQNSIGLHGNDHLAFVGQCDPIGFQLRAFAAQAVTGTNVIGAIM
jgi:hypothetical protein